MIDDVLFDAFTTEDVELIVGDCPTGADAEARDVARGYKFDVRMFVAGWGEHGKAAGPIRNQQMIDAAPDRVVAYWDGKSRGTLDLITRAAKAGIPVDIR